MLRDSPFAEQPGKIYVAQRTQEAEPREYDARDDRAERVVLLLSDAKGARHRVVVVEQSLLTQAGVFVECPMLANPIERSANPHIIG